MIWKFAVGGNAIRPYWIRYLAIRMKNGSDLYQPPPHRFALLRACRQIYFEAAQIMLHSTTFRFQGSGHLMRWLRKSTVHERRAIRVIECSEPTTVCYLLFSNLPGYFTELEKDLAKLASKLPNLQRVDLQYWSEENIGNNNYTHMLRRFDTLIKDIESKTSVKFSYEISPDVNQSQHIFYYGDEQEKIEMKWHKKNTESTTAPESSVVWTYLRRVGEFLGVL